MLIDTHVFLWMQTDPDQLGDQLDVLQDASTDVMLSAVSSWEIAIKWALGKLPLPEAPERYVPDRIRRSAISPLNVTHGHALAVAALPRHHADPFDRMLIAQAIVEGLPLVTADSQFSSYDVSLMMIGGR